MEFMLIFYNDESQPSQAPDLMPEMGEFAGKLAAQGEMRGGAPLKPGAEGARIRVSDGDATVTDGPFTETKEIIGGFFTIECEDREEAIEVAKTCPHARVETVEVREVIPVGGPPSA